MARVLLLERQMARFLRKPVTVRSAASVIVSTTAVIVLISGVLMRVSTTASIRTSSSGCGGRFRP